jgi:protein gp37
MAGTRLRHQPRYEGLTRLTTNGPRWTGVTRFNADELIQPLHWKKPRMIFVCSMADLFHESVPFEWIDKVWAVMAMCPQHTFQVLTKRPERMAEYLSERARSCYVGAAKEMIEQRGRAAVAITATPVTWPVPNVWIGTSTEDQQRADERIPHLLKCPAAVRFLSVEPLLGEVDLRLTLIRRVWDKSRCPAVNCPACGDGCSENMVKGLHWIIVGGESGRSARPCTIGHIRSIVRQCAAAGTPCFVKQLGSKPVNREGEPHPIKDHHNIDEFPEDLRVRQWPGETR